MCRVFLYPTGCGERWPRRQERVNKVLDSSDRSNAFRYVPVTSTLREVRSQPVLENEESEHLPVSVAGPVKEGAY